jgi:hypothetical protein
MLKRARGSRRKRHRTTATLEIARILHVRAKTTYSKDEDADAGGHQLPVGIHKAAQAEPPPPSPPSSPPLCIGGDQLTRSEAHQLVKRDRLAVNGGQVG